MTKLEFLAHVAALYTVGNRADSDSERREYWTHPDMAGHACCAALDDMLRDMVACGALSADEKQAFYDNM